MRISFKVSLTVSIMAIVGSLSLIFYLHIRSVSDRAAREAAGALFNSAFQTVEAAVFDLINDAFETADLAAQLDEAAADASMDDSHIAASASLRVIFQLLRQNPSLYSLYFGYEDSRFLQVIAAQKNPLILKAHGAPATTWWIVRTITGMEKRHQNWVFLNKALEVLSQRSEPNPGYDPRKRPWYKTASITDQTALSDVYLFNSLQQPGITASKRKANHQGIAGVDLTLHQLKHLVSTINISEHSRVIIVDSNNRIIAASGDLEKFSYQDRESATGNLISRLSAATGTQLRQLEINGETYYAKTGRAFSPGPGLKVMAVAPMGDFNRHFSAMQKSLGNLTLVWLLLFVPVTFVFSKHMSNRLSLIASDAGRIRDLNFTPKQRTPSFIHEFYSLEKSFDTMRLSLSKRTRELDISQAKLNRLVELGIAISAEHDAEKLMERVLLGAKELTNADGGTLYKIENDALKFKIIRNDTLDLSAGGPGEEEIQLDPVRLYTDQGEENHSNVVSHTFWKLQSILIDDAYENESYDFSGTRIFDNINGYHSQSFLTVPLMPLGGNPIGALQLINCTNEQGETVPFNPELLRFVEALAAQAATILYNLELLEGQKALFDSMIQIIAGSIDAKSPYTGGHCKRVPELAMMIAQEACQSSQGSFANFKFRNEDQWREFSIGAWLHDCGKVVTPEYVVDKATKLETIYDRIHEIRTRFEVLLRDARIEYYKGLSQGKDPKILTRIYEQRKQDLTDKFAFVAECNVGEEFMGEEKIERLKAIGREEWVRNFDIRLGLSHQERPLYQSDETLPHTETLLADKACHIIKRSEAKDPYAGLGFNVTMPENLYNRGEVYNLSVRSGTLTPEERFKISEHIMQTIAMLDKLPFPSQLARVPEYAGTHHETMAGTGYPRRLGASELSLPARIMAVADIFEALTASDRPYKEAKPLSEAIAILHSFKIRQHIDPEVFDLFLSSGVYLEYAKKFLKPEQIDEVDIPRYLS